MNDLRLIHLTYAGFGKPDARIEFDPALTVIYGASDTGKSFIAESIEYMLGGTKLELVSEAKGYSQILLGLQLPDGGVVTLLRAPGSNTIRIHHGDHRGLLNAVPESTVTAVHTSRSKSSLSLLLMGQLGLTDLRVRKNDAGGTRELTLTDLMHLSVIPETRMLAPVSPVLRLRADSGRAAGASVMKLLLTGEGEPNVDTGLNAGQRRVNKGQINLLDQLVVDLHAKLSTDENVTELRSRLVRLQGSIDEYANTMRSITDGHLIAVTRRLQVANELVALESRLAEVGDLVSRFHLLEDQYRSDLARLEMVAEAGSLLGYFNVGTCVFCGAEPEHQNPDHGQHEATQLHIAVRSESAKTHALLADLLPTIEDLRTQFDDLTAARADLLHETILIETELAATEAMLAPMRERTEEAREARSVVERNLNLHAQIEELEERRSHLAGKAATSAPRRMEYIPSRILSVFDDTLRQTLDAWTVPSVEFAEYDQIEMDVRAGSRLRASRGKGVRSVLHSAFTTALAQYCSTNEKPHPGFIVLDSPVVTYRGPISDPVGDDIELAPYVLDRFYLHMLTVPGQTVILENGDPPPEVIAQARIYRFTESGSGGFFPTS